MKRVFYSLVLVVICCVMFSGCNKIKVGQTIKANDEYIAIEDISFSREKEEFRDRVEPENPQGYYDLYEHYEGYTYYVITGKAKNNSDTAFSSKSCTFKADVDGKTVDAKLVFLNEDGSKLKEDINSQEECTYIMFTLLEEGQKPDNFKIYYNDNFQTSEDENKFDKQVIVNVKK